MAVKDLNQSGGVLGRKAALVVEDTDEASSGAKAVTAYRKLRLSNDIQFLIGPTWTPGGLALAPIISRDRQVVVTSPSLGVAEFNKTADNIFNTHGAEELASRAIARFALSKGWRRIAIWSSHQPWELAQAGFFEDELIKGGGEVAAKIEDLPTITVLDSQALKIAGSNPQAVFFSVIGQQAIAAKALRKIAYKNPMLAVYVDETRLKESDGALEGTIFGRMALPTEEFVRKFKSAFPEYASVESPAGTAYDTVMIYARAIEKAGTFEPTKVTRELLRIQYRGASGKIEFDDQGGARRMPVLKRIKNGKAADLEADF